VVEEGRQVVSVRSVLFKLNKCSSNRRISILDKVDKSFFCYILSVKLSNKCCSVSSFL
jgi:hypothetical protein